MDILKASNSLRFPFWGSIGFTLFLLCFLSFAVSQPSTGDWVWSLNGKVLQIEELESYIFCLDEPDSLLLEYLPSEQLDSTEYLWTGVEFWLQAFMNQATFMADKKSDKAEPTASIAFTISELVPLASLPPGETALSGALRIKPLLLIKDNRIMETIEPPQSIQELSITLVTECSN